MRANRSAERAYLWAMPCKVAVVVCRIVLRVLEPHSCQKDDGIEPTLVVGCRGPGGQFAQEGQGTFKGYVCPIPPPPLRSQSTGPLGVVRRNFKGAGH
jgi:hypothetical protein